MAKRIDNAIVRRTGIFTGKNDLELLYTIKDFPAFMGCVDDAAESDWVSDLEFLICPKTGVIQLGKVLPLELVYHAPHNEGIGGVWERHYEKFSEFILKSGESKILEIGGAHLKIAKLSLAARPDLKWEVIEPNPLNENENKEIKVTKGWFDAETMGKSASNCVVHSHVIEHMYNPVEFMQTVQRGLKVGQRQIFSFPNMRYLLGQKFTNCLNFEHTVYLTEDTIEDMLRSCGFEIEEKQYFESHSIFYRAKKVEEKTQAVYRNAYVENKKTFMDFVVYHKKLVADLNQKIQGFDGPVYVFGAHIFAQYLFGFGLETQKIVGILDNSVIKNKKRLYGTSLGVDKPEVIAGQKNVAVVLKVAGYRDEIYKQLKAINPAVEIFE